MKFLKGIGKALGKMLVFMLTVSFYLLKFAFTMVLLVISLGFFASTTSRY